MTEEDEEETTSSGSDRDINTAARASTGKKIAIFVGICAGVWMLLPFAFKASTARASDSLDWLTELPTVAAVEAAYSGTDETSTGRRVAAFAVLADYLEVMGGADQKLVGAKLTATLPPAALPIWEAYVGRGYGKTLPSVTRPGQLFASPNFRREVLGRYVSKGALAAYEKRIPSVMNPSRVATAPTAPSEAEGDLRKARSANVDTTIFGLPLGEPSSIPDCPKVDIFTMSTKEVNKAWATKAAMDTCRMDATEGPMNLASALILDPEGAGHSEISLAASKRPPWVTATGMLIKGGVVIAVTIATTDENQKTQIAALRAKYGRPQPQSVEGIMEWRLPGLYVRFQDRSSIPQPTQYAGGNAIGNAALNYGSIMGRAKKPNLFIMLESVHKNQLERKTERKAAEPKL